MRKASNLWPDDYRAPVWLPNWRQADEYAPLTIQKSYSYACKSPDSDQDIHITPDAILKIRQIPGPLKVQTRETPKIDFAWEFLRRNPQYQADYQYLTEQAIQDGVLDCYQAGVGLSITKQIDETFPPPSRPFHALLYRTLTKWGLAAWLPNPSQYLHDTPPLQALSRMGVDCWESDVYFMMDEGEPIPYDGGIILTDTEASFIFDITRPLTPQLQHAKEVFEAAQKRINNGRILKSAGLKEAGKKKAENTEKLYVTYLRILDATTDKQVTDKDIINQFHTEGLLDTPYGYDFTAKSHTNRAINTLHNWKKAAVSLRDNGYKYLL